MTKPDRPLLADVKEEVASLKADVAEMLALRLELARRELVSDVLTLRRLTICAAVALTMALTSLPLLAVAGAWLLRDRLHIPFAGWLAIFAAVLFLAAALLGWCAYRRFRRDFTGLAQTLEECREDFVWLREWSGKK